MGLARRLLAELKNIVGLASVENSLDLYCLCKHQRENNLAQYS